MRKGGTETLTSAQKIFADLHQLFPGRALMLIEGLRATNREQGKFPKWREEQIAKLGIMVVQSALDLERAYSERRITALAWATRNLLELSVWIDYCNLSDNHAKLFSDDSLRDLYGLSEAVQRTVEMELGQKDTDLDRGLSELAHFAQALGIQALKDDFKAVSAAAKELGRLQKFQAANKLLSKFAHPTSWAVHIADTPGPIAGYLTMILQDGAFLAMNAIIAIRKTIRSEYPEIARSKGD